MAADDAAVLEHFDVRDGVLVGHSMGGFVAIRAVLDHPELAQRLRGLVLFATLAGRILDGAPQNRLPILLLQSGVTATAGAYQDRWRAVRRLLCAASARHRR